MKKRLLIVGLVLLILVSCTSPETLTPAAQNTNTPSPITDTPVKPSATPEVLPPNTFGVVDASTFYGKVVVGYQGWFGCPTDDSGIGLWGHWSSDAENISIDTIHFEYWPDTTELTEDELCPTGIFDAQGNELYLYSAYHPLTIKRHFLWMAQYGIDGIELQRFANELEDARYLKFRNQVLENVRAGAEEYGRIFFIQYDGTTTGTIETIKQDWKYLVDSMNITSSPAYLHHNELPVVGLWGLGLLSRDITPEAAQDLIDFFQNNPEPKYRATVQGGVPAYWRTLSQDSKPEAAWADVYRSLDIINPWHTSAIGSQVDADYFLENTIIPDIEETNRLGIDYMPTVFSGFSWSNLYDRFPLNQTPRDGGKFLWKLAYNVISQDVKMLEIAMFDEVDEGTQIMKVVETGDQLPPGDFMLAQDADGYKLPSDWYLILAGRITAMLHGDIALTPEIADLPDQDLSGFQTVTINFTSQSDWNDLFIQNPDVIEYVEIVSSNGPISHFNANKYWISFSQSLKTAEAGYSISAQVRVYLKPDAELKTLNLKLRKGNIGWSTIEVTTIVDGVEIELANFSHQVNPNDPEHLNTLEVEVPLDF